MSPPMPRTIPRLALTALISVSACLRTREPGPGAQTMVEDTPAPGGSPAPVLAPGAGRKAEPDRARTAAQADPVVPVADAGSVPVDWAQGAEPGSLQLVEHAIVHARADVRSPALGLIEAGVRVAVLERITAADCAHEWIGVAPRGYVCAQSKPTTREPTADLLPRVPAGRVIPGSYGRVEPGAPVFATLADAELGVRGAAPDAKLTVRRDRIVKAGGKKFWKTRQGYIEARHIRRFGGSSFEGVALDGADAPTLPIAWVLPKAMLAKVALKEAPRSNAKVVRWLQRRERVELASTEVVRGHFAVRGGGFIDKARLAVASHSERPSAAAADERWLDIDLTEQTLVAYEGEVPVYATLISAGRPGHSTPTGVFRISRKVAERTMNSMADSDEVYSVAKVPWTAYFAPGYALHAAYWHDSFGFRKSHGCVNLSPQDARALYAWTTPAVAPGWSEVLGHEDQPGSVIRIRDAKHPDPATQGYALAMLEADTVLALR